MNPVEPHWIRPSAVYTFHSARQALGLAKNTLAREIRLKRLRASRRAGRYYLLGEWLLEWLRAGEVRPGGNSWTDDNDAVTAAPH